MDALDGSGARQRTLPIPHMSMGARHYPDLIGIGRAILSDGMRIPEWWRTKTYAEMRKDWSHELLKKSVEDDIMNGQVPPREVMDDFPELR